MFRRILHWLCRLILAGIFLYTGYIKLRSPLQFAAVLAGYQLFPDALILPMADYFPWIEIALGVLLLVGGRSVMLPSPPARFWLRSSRS